MAFDPGNALKHYDPQPRAGRRIEREVAVHLVESGLMGCAVEFSQRPGGPGACDSFTVTGTSGEEQTIAAIRERARAAAARQGIQAAGAMLVKRFDQAAAFYLERRLGERFARARVTARPGEGSIPVKAAFRYEENGRLKRARVTLEARPAGGAPIKVAAVGEETVSLSHLAWVIPASLFTGLLTFPIFIQYAGRAPHQGASERVFTRALDAASLQLATALAERPAEPQPAADTERPTDEESPARESARPAAFVEAPRPLEAAAPPPPATEMNATAAPQWRPWAAAFRVGGGFGLSNGFPHQGSFEESLRYRFSSGGTGFALGLALQQSVGGEYGGTGFFVGSVATFDIALGDRVQLSPTLALGYQLLAAGGASIHGLAIQPGLDLRLRLGDRVALLFRPVGLSFLQMRVTTSSNDKWQDAIRYDLSIGTAVLF
jgi:hypothetical protein